MSKKLWDFKVQDHLQNTVSLSDYAGKYILIVNTASQCGLTSQYKDLEQLYQKHKENLEILAFPCNQFGMQEPENDTNIQKFCQTNFALSFPVMAKIKVQGKDADPLFVFLRKSLPGILGTTKIKWNFTKFLLSPEGEPLQRFSPQSKVSEIEKKLLHHMQKTAS